jgi:hypothetical protein
MLNSDDQYGFNPIFTEELQEEAKVIVSHKLY